MRGCFGFFIFIGLTIWLLFSFLGFTAIRSWAFERNFYNSIIDNDALYNAFREEGLPQFLANLKVNGQRVLDPNSTAFPALIEAMQGVLTTDYLRTTTVGLVDNLFTFFENPSSGLRLNIDLAPIKEALSGAQGDAFVRTYLGVLQPCTTTINFSSNQLPTCLPQGVTQEQAIATVTDYKNTWVSEMPVTWDLMAGNTIDFSRLPNVSLVQSVNSAYGGLAIITVVVWFFNALIGGQGLKGLLMWLGGMLFLPALIILLTGAVFGGTLLDSIANDVVRQGASASLDISPRVQESFTLVILNALRQVSNGFLGTGTIALVVSLVLYLMGAIMRRPNRQTVNVGHYNDLSYPIKPL